MPDKTGKIVIKYQLRADSTTDLIHGVRELSNAIADRLDELKNIPQHDPEMYLIPPKARLLYWNFE